MFLMVRYVHNRFSSVHVPPGRQAVAYALVPVEGSGGAQCGHTNTVRSRSHTYFLCVVVMLSRSPS